MIAPHRQPRLAAALRLEQLQALAAAGSAIHQIPVQDDQVRPPGADVLHGGLHGGQIALYVGEDGDFHGSHYGA